MSSEAQSDYHLLGFVLVPVVGIVIAFLIVFICKGLDLCLPSGPGPYAHLAHDAVQQEEPSTRSRRRRDKQSEAEQGAMFVTSASGAAPPAAAPTYSAAAPTYSAAAMAPPNDSVAVMAARAPMPPEGPLAPMRLLNREQY